MPIDHVNSIETVGMILPMYFLRMEDREVQFLGPGDPAHQVLVEHIKSKAFLSQLNLCTHGVHTGKLEVLHSMFLAYVSKRIDYDPPSYHARIQLAILDHNENCTRKPLYGEWIWNSVNHSLGYP